MSKRELKLEFEYSVRAYTNEINVDCHEITVRPVGDMAGIFPEGFEGKLNSVANESIHRNLSFAAMNFKEAAMNRAPEGTSFSKKAYFTDSEGKIIEVSPATFTPH